eukprot:CAMPEP_0201571378 /NCGR_PEP_ID=MMETSP0190_2-20130828/14127_1 /ASSEMBLY_ACC=CAM_ASM_000263 /TAXON_ID=37353 /ORGANISM="Rosalina sp." /LENGTH=75 /DNA_ID=CAMNT_0047995961 /DNA_START=30 /DNA_END=254 /DNA_ORIENTATION=+
MVGYEIKCPRSWCGKNWELEECKKALNMSDELYQYYNELIAKRAPGNWAHINGSNGYDDHKIDEDEVEDQVMTDK